MSLVRGLAFPTVERSVDGAVEFHFVTSLRAEELFGIENEITSVIESVIQMARWQSSIEISLSTTRFKFASIMQPKRFLKMLLGITKSLCKLLLLIREQMVIEGGLVHLHPSWHFIF